MHLHYICNVTLVQTLNSKFEPSSLHAALIKAYPLFFSLSSDCSRHAAHIILDDTLQAESSWSSCCQQGLNNQVLTVCCSRQVKIQKMRSNLEEKLMRRMTTVHRRAEEWRATAQAQHLQQLQRAAAAAGSGTRRLKAASHHRHLPGSDAASCGCFPCSSNVVSGNLLNYY